MHYKKIMTPLVLAASLMLMTACSNEVIFSTPIDTSETSQTEAQTLLSGEASTKDYGYTTMFESDLPQFRRPQIGDIVVTLVTNYGEISLLMFPEVAPKAVENFITHGEESYYDGIIFHRVIKDFMIQGGDPTGTGRGGESIWGQPFEDEFDDLYFPFRGALAMANSGAGTNGSQFFIVQTSSYNSEWDAAMLDYGFDPAMIEAHKSLGGTPHLFNKHTVFGQVVKGMDVVDTIANVKVGSSDKPVEDVVIEEVTMTEIE